METRLIRIDEVLRITALRRSTLYELLGRDAFPAPLTIAGTRIRAWSSVDIQNWVSQQVTQRDSQKQETIQ